MVASDLAAALDLGLPQLSDALGERLRAVARNAVTANPVDLAGAGEEDFANFERVTRVVLESGEVDAVVLTGYFGGYSSINEAFRERETEVARAIVAAVDETGVPLFVQAMFWQSAPAGALREGGVPVYREIEAALGTLAKIAAAGLPGDVPSEGAGRSACRGDRVPRGTSSARRRTASSSPTLGSPGARPRRLQPPSSSATPSR